MEQSKTYVEFLYPGMLFTETDEKQVANRNIQTLKIPTQAFGFLFFDKTIKTIELDGKKTVVNGKRRNVSGIYYPNGKVFSLDEVKSMGKDYSILASNMEGNNWKYAVKTRKGNFQPFTNKDHIIVCD